jgi:hypothetical protein
MLARAKNTRDDVGEEESLVDDDVGGILVGGVAGGALVGVPFPAHVGIAALLLVISLILFLPSLVISPVTVTRYRTFSNEMTGLTTLVAHLLGAGFVILPSPLLEGLVEALDDERHFLVVELGGVDGDSTWRRFLFFSSSVASNATGCTSGVEVPPCSKLMICLEPLIINSKLTNFPITSSGDISLYLGSPRIN